MGADISHNLTIELKSQGRNVIPVISEGNIVTIHGKNGVGKSMAATLLEIASGNYLFENENQFQKLANIIELCEIIFKNEDQILYRVELKPHLWSFDKNLNQVNPFTLGTFFKGVDSKQKEINFEEFQRNVYIRTIRGNESLQQQIFFFKDIFVAKINHKLEKLEQKISFLEGYQKWLNLSEVEDIIEKYSLFQQNQNDQLNRISNFEANIKNRESTIKKLEKRLDILKKIIFIDENNVESLTKTKELEEKKVDQTHKEREANYKELSRINHKLDDYRNKFDKKTKDFLEKLDKLREKRDKLKNQLVYQFKFDLDNNYKKSNQRILEIKRNINSHQEEIDKNKKAIEELNTKNERIIEINKYLIQLRDICSKASSFNYGKDKFIKVMIDGEKENRFSFQELYEIFHLNNIEIKSNEELQEYKRKVQDLNGVIIENRKKLEILTEYNKIQEKMLRLKKEIKKQGTKIENYIDLDTRINTLEKQKLEIELKNVNLDKDLLTYNQKIQDYTKIIERLKSIPSKASLMNELEKLGSQFDRKELSLEVCKKRIIKNENDIKESQKEINNMKNDKANTLKELQKTREGLNKYSNEMKETSKRFGYSQVGAFLDYIKPHINKFKIYRENTNNLYNRLKVFKFDIENVISGLKPRNKRHLRIINQQFDQIFKEVYNRKEFFDYVFKDYSGIKQFDIGNRTIIFETIGGLEETRDLEEFSSGEKTYAYCRSIISMTTGIAKYNIVILDESYALLDHEHGQNLYQFQETIIREKKIAKFINILPLKENLPGLITTIKHNLEEEQKRGDSSNYNLLKSQLNILQSFQEEVDTKGYYQEIHFPKESSKELYMNFGIIPDFTKSPPQSSYQEESEELEFSFILDGSNIARDNPNSKKASIRDVKRCWEKLMKFGIPEKNIFIIFGSGLRHHIPERDKYLYESLLNKRTVNQAPAERDDDWFIIKFAMDHNSYIITNDRYLNYRTKSPDYERFIKSHSIHYSVVGTDIIFDESFKEILKTLGVERKDNK